MGLVYILFIVLIVGLVCFRIFKKKSISSNSYTPYDDITMGVKDGVNRGTPIHDTKHTIKYEERVEDDQSF
ncbi:DUF3951 domain-containing protein [Virgibacillus kekensis]|uniref:DUF3951 domain-containing protein n=1 Tax=Virgibacillus kekensis TaxID=202261 RepID=A0ABV9DFS0_9BACI